ncbi:four helix bundle protein [Poritiphilus flavus]|uniref:Four helix bundle protein n=1 Tax=Poritiphilus flavus TaxID=2697053 RepID=A0A6L9E6T1_9FLAO|nr:four helix bundle protein [Poritiphilus flavus]NAS10455.1 four helix bundle protein [Poritiphilus flavus]
MRYQSLIAYQKSFLLAMQIFEVSKTFPVEERYALTNQIRRSSRSVAAAIAESYGKRKYPKHFINKLTDSDSENLETQTWLRFALECKYIDNGEFKRLMDESTQVGKLISHMIRFPEKFGSK